MKGMMNNTELNIVFLHPTDGRMISVTMDGSMTGLEVIEELIKNDFISSSNDGYGLAILGGALIDNFKSFLDSGIENNSKIRIIPSTAAGG